MNDAVSTHLDALRREAEKQKRGEASLLITSKGSVKMRLGLREPQTPQYFLEVVVPLCQDGCIDLNKLEHSLCVLRALESMDYSLECSDSIVSCEKIITEYDIDAELELIRKINCQ